MINLKKRERTFSGTKDPNPSPREIKNRAIAREAACESIILLKNDGVLPLDIRKKVALFGGGADHTIKGGTGSGDVNERDSVSIYQGMLNAGFSITSEEWIDHYNTVYTSAREAWKDKILKLTGESDTSAFFDHYSANAFFFPDGRPIRKTDLENTDTAIYVISRIAGEGADRKLIPGDYYLSDAELTDLRVLNILCRHVVIIINAGGQIDLKEILKLDHVHAILSISQPGMEGGNAVADILSGAVSPSGKTTHTWTLDYEDFPGSRDFSYLNHNTEQEFYREGIYVGYRYFDSFGIEPVYPFGHGLSYTEFSIQPKEVTVSKNTVSVSAAVTNIGSSDISSSSLSNVYSGKEVLQVYAACPQSGLSKESKRLVGFAKTALLSPGETETLSISFDAKDLSSFDEQRCAYILEKGLYEIFVGNSSNPAALIPAGLLEITDLTIIEKTKHICPLQTELYEIICSDDALQQAEAIRLAEANELGLVPILFSPEEEFPPLIEDDEYDLMADELSKKLTDEELTYMVVGEVSRNHNLQLESTPIMVPGAASETCSILEEKYGVPGIATADGPAGLRIYRSYEADEKNNRVYAVGFMGAIENGFFHQPAHHEGSATYYQYCTAIPVGTALAQTWNVPLIEKVGHAIGNEMEEFGITLWLAPGMNIHRNPLCGRNFEYYSEDPVLAGNIAAAMTRGVQMANGVGTTIKHFACNNLEDNRFGSDSIISERALREIYLRGFEIAVKTSQPMAIMTSYNLINGIHSANNYDLCTQAARKEWGFRGLIMTDWTTTTYGGSTAYLCPAAGNDLIMPGETPDIENILEALRSGKLDRETLRLSVKRILSIIFQSLGYEDAKSYGEKVK